MFGAFGGEVICRLVTASVHDDTLGSVSARISKRTHRRTQEVSFLQDEMTHSFEIAGLTEVLRQATLLQEDVSYIIRIVRLGCNFSSQASLAMRDAESDEVESLAADTLVIAADPLAISSRDVRSRYLHHVRQGCLRSRRVVSVASGTMLLAATGLLDGRKATIHWGMRESLQRMYPKVVLQDNTLFTEEQNIYTCAGATAILDVALRLVEIDCGRLVAASVARRLLLYQRRSGDASQISLALLAQSGAADPIYSLLTWLPGHLVEDLSIEKLARRVAMSPRNFARIFRQQVGMTPARYVESLRFEAALFELRDPRQTVARAAEMCGFANSEALRRLFTRRVGLTPANFRKVAGESHCIRPAVAVKTTMELQEMTVGY